MSLGSFEILVSEFESLFCKSIFFSVIRKKKKGWEENTEWNNWRSRYVKFYSNKYYLPQDNNNQAKRISFMGPESDTVPPLIYLRNLSGGQNENDGCTSFQQQMTYPLYKLTHNIADSSISESSSKNETLLLEMVRRRNQEFKEVIPEEPLELPNEDEEDTEDTLCDICIHGLSMPMNHTDRSVSRSKVSRVSTRRDMDIPSILAFTADNTDNTFTEKPHLGLPAFQNLRQESEEKLPRWSIRRSMCPVCSQKWKDRSAIRNIKYSGLKKNSSMDLPSITAPARLKTSLMIKYQPRPVIDEEPGAIESRLRNTGRSWQLIRARKFHLSKPNKTMITDPPSATAPLARKNLDTRVNKFLSNENVNNDFDRSKSADTNADGEFVVGDYDLTKDELTNKFR